MTTDFWPPFFLLLFFVIHTKSMPVLAGFLIHIFCHLIHVYNVYNLKCFFFHDFQNLCWEISVGLRRFIRYESFSSHWFNINLFVWVCVTLLTWNILSPPTREGEGRRVGGEREWGDEREREVGAECGMRRKGNTYRWVQIFFTVDIQHSKVGPPFVQSSSFSVFFFCLLSNMDFMCFEKIRARRLWCYSSAITKGFFSVKPACVWCCF